MKNVLKLLMIAGVLLVFGISCSKDEATGPGVPSADLTAGFILPSGENILFAYQYLESDLFHPTLYGPNNDSMYRLKIPAYCIIDSIRYSITITANIEEKGTYGYDANVIGQGERGVLITGGFVEVGNPYSVQSFISYDAYNKGNNFNITSITENHVLGFFDVTIGNGRDSVFIRNGEFNVLVERGPWVE